MTIKLVSKLYNCNNRYHCELFYCIFPLFQLSIVTFPREKDSVIIIPKANFPTVSDIIKILKKIPCFIFTINVVLDCEIRGFGFDSHSSHSGNVLFLYEGLARHIFINVVFKL